MITSLLPAQPETRTCLRLHMRGLLPVYLVQCLFLLYSLFLCVAYSCAVVDEKRSHHWCDTIIVYSLLISVYSLLIIFYSLLIIVYSLLIIFYSLLILVHYLLIIFLFYIFLKFGDRMPLFLFIFHIFVTYIHSFNHIHTIHSSIAIR